jgi:hypothetical protein
MRISANVTILGKIQKPWIDNTGVERTSYSANIMQNNGEIVDTLRLSQEQYNSIEVKKEYILQADYGTGKNGGYLRLIDITPLKAAN